MCKNAFAYGFAGEFVKQRQQQKTHHKGKNKCHQRNDYRLAQKLDSQLIFKGADNFAETNFLRPFGGAGGGEVNKVYAGDQQNKNGNDGKNINICLASRLQALL